MLHSLFHMGISAGEKAIRTALVYGAILVLLHLSGKRQLAQLNSFDLVVLLLLSNVVQNAIIGSDNSLTGGLLGAAILVAINYVVVRAAFMDPRIGKAIQGRRALLYDRGVMNKHALRREAITREELIVGLRRQGLELKDVERVWLEPEGVFNAEPKPKPDLGEVMAALTRIEQHLG